MLSDLSLHSFSSSDVCAMEMNVLIALDYSVWRVTPFDFLIMALAALEATPQLAFCSFVGVLEALKRSIFWKAGCSAAFSRGNARPSRQ